MMSNATASSPMNYVHVVGADVDRELLSSLVPGDHLLVELNGHRVFTESAISSPEPWRVVSNDAKIISVAHPASDEILELPYDSLIKPQNKSPDEPAVFLLKREGRDVKTVWVVLQLISHKSTPGQLEKLTGTFNPDEYKMIFEDATLKRGMLEAWCNALGTFSEKGWGYRSVKRFALRSSTSIATIKAFRSEAWDKIKSFDDETLLNIAREMELVTTLIRLSRSYAEQLSDDLANRLYNDPSDYKN
jgi:hypothetical protein